MPLTLLDVASVEHAPMAKAVLMAMFESVLPSPMEQLPIENATSLGQKTVRMTDGGSPSTRHLNAAVAEYSAKFSDRIETLKIIENKVTIDKVLLEVKDYIQDPLALQMKAYSAVIKSKVNELFINGDPGADPTTPAGLHYRLSNDGTFVGQSVNAAGLDVDASDANRLTWLDHIDEAITLANGVPDFAIVNRQTWIRFRSALRALKLLDNTRDQFDRVVMVYGSVKILDAGQKVSGVIDNLAADQIIANDGQTSIFGTASSTPMYFVRTGGEEGVRLLQLHSLRTQKLGLDPGDPGQYVIDVTWPIGFATPTKFCISSVQGLDIS